MTNTTKSLVHGAVSVALFAIPMILMSNSPGLDLTVGGILNAIYHYLIGWSQA